jgi:serine/threonine-protein kinase
MSPAQPGGLVNTDRNLLFGVLALQADLLDASQFAQACTAWSACKDRPLAELLVERGWLTHEDRSDIERLLERKLKKHAGDAHASLAAVVSPPTRTLLAAVADPDIQQSLADAPAGEGHTLLSTLSYELESRERYILTRVHATGGVGQVWLAHDGDLGRDVALKELRPDQADKAAIWGRFVEEARITGQLEHPGIVPVYELARRAQDQGPFYTMRFIKGRTLREAGKDYHRKRLAGRTTPLDLRELLGQFIAVCNAVAYAHSRGVVHRDLKGSNVIVGDFGEVIVLDWGLAKVLGKAEAAAGPVSPDPTGLHSATLHGQVIGTPGYMSPEQAAGRPQQVNERSDVYGLGAMLYEILTGEAPFAGDDTQEVIRRVLEEAPVPPREVVAATPAALEAVCLKALSKAPTERYGSASELASEIRHYLADEPVAAYRDPLPTRCGRWARRHRTLVAGLAAAALVAVVSLTAATVLLTAANRRETEALELAQERGQEAERETAKAKENADLAEQRGQAAERETAKAKENADLADKRGAQAENASAKARANFQLARDAVEEYCTKVSDDPRLKEKDLEELRKDLLQSAVKFHQHFVEQHGKDPALRADLGRAYLDLGKMFIQTSDLGRAIEVTGQAVAIYEQLVKEQPQQSAYPLQLAHALSELGFALHSSNQTKEARAAFYRALDTLAAAAGRHGNSPALRSAFLRTSKRLSYMILYRDGAQAEAIAVYRKAAAFLEGEDSAAVLEPADLLVRADFSSKFGEALVQAGQTKEGHVWCDKAQRATELLIAKGKPSAEIYYGLSAVYTSLGRAYTKLSDGSKALEAFRKAVDCDLQLLADHPGVSVYQQNLGIDYTDLGTTQIHAGQGQEGYANLKKSLEIKEKLAARYPEVADFTASLARALGNMALYTANPKVAGAYQQRGESLFKELTTRHPKEVTYQANLASAIRIRSILHLRAQQVPQALAAMDEAIAVLEKLVQTTDVVEHREELAKCYGLKTQWSLTAGKLDPALAAFRKAMALNPTDADMLYPCGTALLNSNRLDEAIEALSRVVALRPDFAEAQCNLGHGLVRKGQFVEGRAALQRGHELGMKKPGWKYPSEQWVRNADKLIQLDDRLTTVLEGKVKPADAAEQLALAALCRQYKGLYSTAARFFAAAFAEQPQLADDLKAGHRYQAAGVAALAGCGRGKDTAKLDDQERARLRQQALDWLRADLALWAKQLSTAEPSEREAIAKKLRSWQTDAAFSGVRDAKPLADLPEQERADWQKLWAEVDSLLSKIQ